MRKITALCLAILAGMTFAGTLIFGAELSGRKVVIDPGHGGTDPGAVGIDGGGVPNEEDFNLDVSLRLRTRLQNAGCTVVMTRTTDTTVSLTARRDLANNENPNCFVSIHCNSFSDSSANGTETFWWTSGNSADQAIAAKIQGRLIQFLGRANRGVKQGNFTVLTANPPSCLGELLFISNQTEFNLINTDTGKNKSADAALYGILDFLGVTAPTAPNGLSASPQSSSQIQLTWNDNSGIEDSYKIERALSASGPWTEIATTASGATSYTSGGLNGGTTYYYRVRALDSILGNSGYSGTASAATQASGQPVISTQPQNQTVNPGVNVVFTVAASGTAPLTYQWRKNAVALSNGGKISGATTASLSITNVQQTEVGNYSVVVSNPNGSTVSADASLAVNTLIVFNETFETGNLNHWALAVTAATPSPTPLSISTAQNHTSGGTYSAQVNVSSDRMYRNIGVEVGGREKVTFWIYDAGTGSTSATRAFCEIRSYTGSGFESGGLEQLLAIGKYNTVMSGEVWDSTKYQGRIVNGANAGWFNLNASGAPSRSTGWHKFEVERLANGSTVNWYVDGVLSRSFTGLTLPTWDSVVIGSVGTGTTAGDAWFDDFKVEYYDPPVITTQPTNRTVTAGWPATFTVGASGTILSYQWRRSGTNLSNGGNISGATTATLTVSNAQGADAANYDVVVSNGAGPVNSATVSLKVAPAILTPPASQTNNADTTATFAVSAAGQTPLSFQWKKNNVPLNDGDLVSGATTDTLILTSVSPTDAGSYTVQVTNIAGVTSSTPAVLTVVVPPDFTAHPTNHAVAAGANVTFNVQASGTAPLNYQWRRDEADIPGATGTSYTRTNVQSADVGNYSCEVRNSAGSAISFDGVLSVNNPPALVTISNQTVAAGSVVNITNSASDADEGQTLTFSLDAGAPVSANINSTNGLFTWTTTTADEGTNAITVRVTDDGTPPLDHARTFTVIVSVAQEITASISLTDGTLTLTWNSVPEKQYRVQHKATLDNTNWVDLTPDVTATGATSSKTEPLGAGEHYYRVVALD